MTNKDNLLNDIKHYIEEGEMSFLIGAGFSRNVNEKAYPLWGEVSIQPLFRRSQN